MRRRDFITKATTGLLLLASGKVLHASPVRVSEQPLLRFVVASDGHYGQPNTEFQNYFSNFAAAVNQFHEAFRCDFCVMNGDIIHDDSAHLDPAIASLKKVNPKLFVTKGNHDRVSDVVWEQKWNMPVNHDVVIGDQVILMGTTSNEAGKYLCPDMEWFTKKLKQYNRFKNIFIFLHITPVKWTKHGVNCPDFQKLVSDNPNIRAVFNGHDHHEDGIKQLENIPFLFDGHIGGNWGTDYRGFRVVQLMKDNSLLTYMMDPYNKIAEKKIK